MGIRINEFDYGNDCGLCYPIGLTPQFIMASFTGIQQGSLFNPAIHDPPPNRIFKLTQGIFTPCAWGLIDATYNISFTIQLNNTEMRLYNNLGVIFFFEALILPTCSVAFASDFAAPAGKIYYGGRCQLAWVPPGGNVSLRDAVENMGIDPDDDIWVDWYPLNSDTMIIRVIRGEDHSRIHGEHDF